MATPTKAKKATTAKLTAQDYVQALNENGTNIAKSEGIVYTQNIADGNQSILLGVSIDEDGVVNIKKGPKAPRILVETSKGVRSHWLSADAAEEVITSGTLLDVEELPEEVTAFFSGYDVFRKELTFRGGSPVIS